MIKYPTGNAWAAAGILRVLGTIQNSQYANKMKRQQNDLAAWVQEIHDGMYRQLVRPLSLLLQNKVLTAH